VFTLQCSGKNPLQPFGYDLTGAGEGGVRFVLHAGQGVLCGTASHSGIPGTPGDNQVDFSFTDGKTGVAIVPSSCPN
jgi:hypothetical protein